MIMEEERNSMKEENYHYSEKTENVIINVGNLSNDPQKASEMQH
jgi:hypothetical protein